MENGSFDILLQQNYFLVNKVVYGIIVSTYHTCYGVGHINQNAIRTRTLLHYMMSKDIIAQKLLHFMMSEQGELKTYTIVKFKKKMFFCHFS